MRVFSKAHRNLRFALSIVTVSWLSITESRAGNEHEHLQYLPKYNEMVTASKGSLGKLPAAHLFEKGGDQFIDLYGQEVFDRLIPPALQPPILSDPSALWQDRRTAVRKLFDQHYKGKSLDDLSVELARALRDTGKFPKVTPEEALKSLFELSPLNQSTRDYIIIGDLRRKLFRMERNLMVESFKEALKNSARSSTLKTIFTVPVELIKSDAIREIRALYESYGYQVKMYSTVPRGKLLNDVDLDRELKSITQLVREGSIDGMDITGSILERPHHAINANDVREYDRQFEKIFKFSNEMGTDLRIHAFEGANRGSFYESMWDALDRFDKKGNFPYRLRIGHIQAIEPSDILRFSKLHHRNRLVFEVNLESNLKTQATQMKKIVRNIENLHTSRFRVVIGADGLGLMGDLASFENTLIRLRDAGMQISSLETLMKDAYLPISGTRISKSQLLSWQLEREEIRRKILGSRYVPNRKLIPCDVPQGLSALMSP